MRTIYRFCVVYVYTEGGRGSTITRMYFVARFNRSDSRHSRVQNVALWPQKGWRRVDDFGDFFHSHIWMRLRLDLHDMLGYLFLLWRWKVVIDIGVNRRLKKLVVMWHGLLGERELRRLCVCRVNRLSVLFWACRAICTTCLIKNVNQIRTWSNKMNIRKKKRFLIE